MRVHAAPKDQLGWLTSRTQVALTSEARAIEAVSKDGRTLGMVAFDMCTRNGGFAHMAVDAPIAWRTLLRAAFEWAFLQCGWDVLLGVIPAHNARSLRFARHAGLRETMRVKDGWAPGDDLVFLEIRKAECRWLYGQRKVA